MTKWCFHPLVWLVLAPLVVYAQSAGFEFLRFDDPDYILANPFVRGGLSLENVTRAFTEFRHGAVWMPVTWLVYMAGVSLFGVSGGAFHLVNLALHITNALLLLKLCRRLAPKDAHGDWLIVAAVAFWALHPQRVEAAAWVASLKELLWALFALAGLSAWLDRRYLVAYLFCALSCMSKPTAMVLPFLALILESAPSYVAGSATLPQFLKSFKFRLSYLPLILMSFSTGAVAVYSQTHPQGMEVKSLFYAGFFERLLNALVALGLYLAQMALPLNLHLDYRAVPGALPLDAAWGLGALVLATGVFTYLVCRSLKAGGALSPALKSGVVAIIWFLLALAPTLGLFASFGEHARADRFLYVPAMALALAISLWRKFGPPPGIERLRFARALAPGGLILLAIISFRLVSTYRNDTAAFMRTLACDGNHGRALAHVGEARCAEGKLDEGIELLRRSRQVRALYATDGKLAYALMRRGRAEDWQEIRTVCAPFAADPARDQKGQALEALGTAELCARAWQKSAAYLARSILAPARFYSADDAKLKLAFAWYNGNRREEAKKLFAAISKSSRVDLASRAEQALAIISRSPTAILFW